MAHEHVSTQSTWARKTRDYVSTQGTLARKHLRTQGMWARKTSWYVSTQGTSAHGHAFSTKDTQFSRLVLGPFTTYVKLFSDNTSLFSVVNNASVSASSLNNDLVKIRDWTFNWKMSFNQILPKNRKRLFFSKIIIIIIILNNFTNWASHNSNKNFLVRPETNISITCKRKNKKNHERNWSSSKTTAYFTSNIFTDYL